MASNQPWDMDGLAAAEAARRLAVEGPNELPAAGRRSIVRIVADVLREPMLTLLLAGGIVYVLIGDLAEALVLLVLATFSIAVSIVQQWRSEHVLEALRDLSAPRALVIRDGQRVRVAGRDVVRGDLMVLDQGDRVAADALLLWSSNLEVDESQLTGESLPVRKRAVPGDQVPPGRPGGEDQPFAWSGSMVVRGAGIARVMATGAASEMGRIGRSLAQFSTGVPRLRRETARIVRLCAAGGMAVSLLVIILYGLTRGGWLDALLAGIAIGMSVLPEEFPVVLTVFFAMGAWRIAQARVLTRRAAAIETLGSATILCTDKTGTLTENRMTLAQLWSGGKWVEASDREPLPADFHPLVRTAMLASATLPTDPMELAFHDAAARLPSRPAGATALIHSYGLRPDLLAMSNVWESADGERLLAAKGAPEAIATLCRLDADQRRAMGVEVDRMASRGMRVLGVAEAGWTAAPLPETQREHDFRLVGLVGLADPLRPSVPAAIAECRRAGIRVVMITGDYPATARFIAGEAGLDHADVMTGEEMEALDAAALARRLRHVSVFARIMPEQKLRLVEAFRAQGEVVAMTGDGVNDAPSLKAADIGIAMGQRGTDVAREASTIVLLDDDFSSIVQSIRLGRRIYDNICKAMAFIFAVHVPIAGLALLPLLFGLPLLLAPIHIALLEMIIDPVCALVFEAEREERDVMRRPPRSPSEPLFSVPMIGRSLAQGGLALALICAAWFYGQSLGRSAEAIRGMIFLTLLMSTLALIVANLSFGPSGSGRKRHNRTLPFVYAAIGGLTLLAGLAPPVQRLLQIGSLTRPDLVVVAGVAATLFALLLAISPVRRSGRGRPLHSPA